MPDWYRIECERIRGNKLLDEDLDITVFGNPRLVNGKVGNALDLNGRGQYADAGNHYVRCLGNLDHCRHGAYTGMWIRPGQFENDANVLYTGRNGAKIWVENGQLRTRWSTTGRTWGIDYDDMPQNRWYYLEYSWHPTRGLVMLIDNEVVAQDTLGGQRTGGFYTEEDAYHFFLGRDHDDPVNSANANVTLDEVEYWYSNRDYLIAWNYINRGMSRVLSGCVRGVGVSEYLW